MLNAIISSSWTGTGTQQDPYLPLVAEQYPLLSWTTLFDNAPTGPCVINAILDPAVLAQIQLDPNYPTGKLVLSTNK